MADDDVQYELKSVQAIRSTEARTIAKWEKLGWEFVSHDKGTLRTEITFRRPKRQLPWRLIAVAGGALAVLIAVAAAFGLFEEEPGTAAPPAPVVVETTKAPTSTPTAEATPSEEATETTASPKPVEDSVLTVENNTDLAQLLKLGDYCSGTIADFAAEYQGQTITFDGNIAAMNPHGNAKTRYDILVGAGDYSTTSSPGPVFQFRDVNTSFDLHLSGENVSDTIGVGDNLRVTAQVGEYEDKSCLFLLKPMKTEFR